MPKQNKNVITENYSLEIGHNEARGDALFPTEKQSNERQRV